MKLYVANCTKQHHWFSYRLPGNPQARVKMIKYGQQIQLDLSEEDLNVAIEQNVAYGMTPAGEVSRRRGFAGLCYKVDGDPINITQMLDTFSQNDDVKDEAAQQRRKDTAAAISDNIGKALGERAGLDSVPPTRLEVETREEGDSPTISSGIVVHADPTEKSMDRSPRRSRSNNH